MIYLKSRSYKLFVPYFVALLFPFFKIPFVPSNYAPLIMIPLSCLGVFALLDNFKYRKTNIDDMLIYTIYMYPCVVTFLMFFTSDYDVPYMDYIKSLLPNVIGILMIYGFYYIFKKHTIDTFLSGLVFSSKFVLFFGIIEVLTFWGLLPSGIRDTLTIATSGFTSSRIQLFTPEASWATLYIAFIIPIYLYKGMSNSEKYFYFPLYLFIFLYSLSMQSIIIFVLTVFSYLFYFNKNKIKFIIIAIISLTILNAVIYGVLSIYDAFKEGDMPYYVSRIYKLYNINELSFDDVVAIDGSIFVRTMLPIYAFIISFSHPFGVGVTLYPYVFSSVYYKLPMLDMMLSSVELMKYMDMYKIDPRSFYATISVSGGLALLVPFFFLIYRIFKHADSMSHNNQKKIYIYFLFFNLYSFLQFGTFAFVPFSFLLGFYLISRKGV
jgi:hypothetical protein